MRIQVTALVALSVAIVVGLLASATLTSASLGTGRPTSAPSPGDRIAPIESIRTGQTISNPVSSVPTSSEFDRNPLVVGSQPAVRTAAVPYPTLNWTNQTSTFDSNLTPNAGQGAAVAYDPILGDYVMVGSVCGVDCPTDATWLYGGNGWVNATAGLVYDDPFPSLYGESLAWDPAWGGVMLAGGYGPGGPNVQTWLFEQATPAGQYGWFNFTAVVGATNSPLEHFGSMVWDPARDALVYAGGCVFGTCSNGSVASVTYELPGSGASWVVERPLPSSIWGAAMAYDQTTSDVVMFGGSWPNATSHQYILNETWIFNSSGDWSNVTYRANVSNCASYAECYYPAASVFAGMTWDGQFNLTILVGGETGTGTYSNQTMLYDYGRWYPITELNPNISALPSGSGALLDSNSSLVAPTVIGGLCTGSCGGNAWVLEIPPSVLLTGIRYNPVDIGAYDIMSGTFVAGTGSGPHVTFGIGNFYGNYSTTQLPEPNFWSNASFTTHFIYGATGAWAVVAVDKDFLGVEGGSTIVRLTVSTNLSATVGAAPSSSDLIPLGSGSSTVNFSSDVSGGVGSYVVEWDFGDGGSGRGGNISHVYRSSGDFLVQMNVTDGGGGWSYHTLDVRVNPELLASSVENVTATDVGVPVNFNGSWSGGSGSPTFSWQFGDGATGTSENESHTYARSGTMQVNFSLTDSLGYATKAVALSLLVNPVLTAVASPSDSAPSPGTNVTFTVTPSGGTAPFTYSWTFDDGSAPVSGATAHHTFSGTGTYAVAVTVRDKVGSSVTKTLVVSVRSAPSLTTWLTTPPGVYALVGIIAAVVLAGASLLMLRRRRKGGIATSAPTALSGNAGTPSGANSTGPNDSSAEPRG